MIIQKSPTVSPIKLRWGADELYHILNEVIALRAKVKALEAETAGRPIRLSPLNASLDKWQLNSAWVGPFTCCRLLTPRQAIPRRRYPMRKLGLGELPTHAQRGDTPKLSVMALLPALG